MKDGLLKENRKKSDEIRKNHDLAVEITKGLARADVSADIQENDDLMKSLKQLQNSIKESINQEKQRKEEYRRRNWISEGVAQFSGILREKSDDLEDLSYQLISSLVKYLEANQGGFFISETDDEGERYLRMLSCYAYERKKFSDKKIGFNDGLIGSTALEKKSLYISDIPDSYLEITSGLGKSNPRFLLLTPMVHNDSVKGIIEIASFSPLAKYEIEFVEQIAEIIAMTLENIINTKRTEKLLKETRLQAEELSIQEEKVRQNMEELQATQEQAAKQAEKFITFSTTVNHTLIRAEYDVEGVLLYANTRFIRKLGYSGNRDVEGKHISLFIDDKDQEWFNGYWESLALGGAHFEGYMKHVAKNGQDLWTMATYTCMRREDGSVEKILFLAIDTTEQKKQSLDFESQIEALDKLSVKAEFSPDGKLISSNKLFSNAFKYPDRELRNKTVYDFIQRKDIENFSDSWEKMVKGNPLQSQIRMLTKSQEEKWFRASFTSVNNMYGEVSKVIFLGNEITNEKIMENENRIQTDFLKKQEEKFRLENLSLNREVKELKEKIAHNKKYYKGLIHSYQNLLNLDSSLRFIFYNSGEIIYVSSHVYEFFGIETKKPPNNTKELLTRIEKNQKNSFLVNLLDPARPKNFNNKSLTLKDKNKKDTEFNLNFITEDHKDSRVYIANLSAN
jgi:PAS domain S-box-containing protein